jgi:hypothetical protein
MGLMDLLSGGQKQEEYEDFARRYEEGAPHEGYEDEEVMGRHDEVAQHLSPEEYEEVAHEAFARLSPEERSSLAAELRAHGAEHGDDPRALARAAGAAQRQQPGLFGRVLGGVGGGGGSGLLGNPMAKAALAGIAAMAAKRVLRR